MIIFSRGNLSKSLNILKNNDLFRKFRLKIKSHIKESSYAHVAFILQSNIFKFSGTTFLLIIKLIILF